ncbi:uncharacterized protein CDAR_552811 [Caerostris darwini]|uniref:Proton-coupled folate transporter n=1 Tax=Caerostris darwini TaxID=1538125 RepID=A0AAV4R082_9ARAC|nr:uncharacterized protein CDAR_552811 [Caerostris darwini]
MLQACRNVYGQPDSVCTELKKHPALNAQCIEVGNNMYTGVMLLSSLPAVVVAIFLGPWSDKYSRKYPMIFSASGMFLEALCTAILTVFPSVPPIWFVVPSIFAGISGGFIISVSASYSYASDVTNERTRSARFAVIEFFNIAAIVVGNLIGGQVIKRGHLPVMIISPVSFACGLLYVILILRETRPPIPAGHRLQMFRDLLRVDNIKESYRACSKKRPGNIRCQIWMLVWIACMQRYTDLGTVSIGFPFTKKMYTWDVTDFSNASMVFYIVNAIVTIVCIPILSNKLRLHEAALGFVGMLSLISKMFVTSVAYREFMFYFAWISGTLANATGVGVRSRISKLVRKEEIGRAFSLLGTCESITPLLGSTVFLQIFNLSSGFFPGLAFAVNGVLLIPCLIMFGWMMGMPSVSLADYEREEDEKKSRPLEIISSSTYSKLEEEKC